MLAPDVIIVGAGIAGLAAQRELRRRGHRVLLFEKSRGAGGRVATRRGEYWSADLGAQFFAKVQEDWTPLLAGVPLTQFMLPEDSRYPRFYHPDGMSKVAGLLLDGEDEVHFGTRLVAMQATQRGWRVRTDVGEEVEARSVILTPPVPQALDLIGASELTLPEEARVALCALTFRRCLAAVLGAEATESPNWPVIWKNPCPAFDGIFDQTRKGLPGSGTVVVAHTSSAFTDALWDLNPDRTSECLLREFSRAISTQGAAMRWQVLHLHRWRYSEPQHRHPAPFFDTGLPQPLFFAGDAFGRSSVDSAFASGKAAAHALAARLG